MRTPNIVTGITKAEFFALFLSFFTTKTNWRTIIRKDEIKRKGTSTPKIVWGHI